MKPDPSRSSDSVSPCLFDRKLLAHDCVYGGTGDEQFTLKIVPADLMKVNNIIGTFE